MSDTRERLVRRTHRREDVGKERKVVFVVRAGRQLQSVEVRERNADELSLPAGIRTHGDVSVGAAGLHSVLVSI